MPRLRPRRTPAALAVGFLILLAACGDPAAPRATNIPEVDIRLAPVARPRLDVPMHAPRGADALFAGINDRASPRREGPVTAQKEPPRRFQVGVEPDDSRDRATAIEFSGEIWGWIHPPLSEDQADEDWFAATVDLDETRALTVELEPVEGIDLSLELWHRGISGRARRVSMVDAYGAGQGEHLANTALSNGTWFLRVSAARASAGHPWNIRDPYRLRVSVDEVQGGHELEPDDDERHANQLHLAIPMAASLHLGDVDWFRLDTSRVGLDSRIALDILPDPTLGLRWEVITPDRVTLLRGEAEKGRRIHVPNLAVIPGLDALHVVVRAPETLEGMARYTLSAETHALERRTQLEPDDVVAQATRLQVPVTLTGWLHDPKDRDVYHVTPGDARALRVDVDGLPGVRLALELLDFDGEAVARIEGRKPGDGVSLPNWSAAPEGAWFSISAAEGFSPLTPYALSIQVRDTSGEETEPNDSPEQASLVNPDEEGIRGYIAYGGDRDCYGLPVGATPPGGKLAVTLHEGGDRAIRATVYGPGGTLVEQMTLKRSATERLLLAPEPGGPMTLCVEGVEPDGGPGLAGYTLVAMPVTIEPLEDGR